MPGDLGGITRVGRGVGKCDPLVAQQMVFSLIDAFKRKFILPNDLLRDQALLPHFDLDHSLLQITLFGAQLLEEDVLIPENGAQAVYIGL